MVMYSIQLGFCGICVMLNQIFRIKKLDSSNFQVQNIITLSRKYEKNMKICPKAFGTALIRYPFTLFSIDFRCHISILYI